MKTVARPATALSGRLFCATDAMAAAHTVLERAVDGQVWFALSHDPRSLGDLVDVAARARGTGAEADHRDPGIDAEGPR